MKTEELERWLDRAPKGKKQMPALKGVRGAIKFEAENGAGADSQQVEEVACLRIEEGEVELTNHCDQAQAVLVCDSKAEVARLLRGEAHPMVGVLQGRIAAQGDLELALRLILDLRGGSPFAEQKGARKEKTK